jgi:hypothetical protein
MKNAHHEELVEVKTEDGLVHAGLLVQPADRPSHSVGVVWVHGAGVNFYHPTFLRIGRDLASRGVPFVTGNNRGHDFGSPLGWVENEAIRGGERLGGLRAIANGRGRVGRLYGWA